MQPAHDAGDPGLFGPGSVTWRVHADPLLGVGGLSALLLQALHPVAMTGLAEHSTFQQDPWGRLQRTAEYVTTVTYGTRVEAMTAAARVRGVHRRVRGLDAEGTPYEASDPELLAWVHCCLTWCFLDVTRRGGLDLDDDEADAYVAEQVRAAVLVGLEPEDVPHDVAGLRAYFEGCRERLRVTPAAREAAAYVIAPPLPARVAFTTPARPAWAAVAGLAFAAMPAWARRAYWFAEPVGAAALGDGAATVALRVLRAALGGVQTRVPALREPPALREAWRRTGG